MHIDRSGIGLASLALGLVLSTTGCATVKGMAEGMFKDPKELDKRDVQAAVDAKDLDRLTKMCDREIKLRSYDGQTAACEAQQQLVYEDFKALTDCDAIAKTVEEGKIRASDFVSVSASKLAKCGNWDQLFVQLIHREADGESDGGPEALAALAKEGYGVEKEFLAFLERHKDKPMSFEYSNYAASHLTDWLKENGSPESCQALVPYVSNIEEGTQSVFYWYFAETKCMEAADMMVRALASDSAGVRRAACRHLGAIGGPAVLDKLQLLANNDAAYDVEEQHSGSDVVYVKVYPVRAACAESANKITLRSGS